MTFNLVSFLKASSVVSLLVFAAAWFTPAQAAEAQQLYAYKSGKRGSVTFTTKRPVGKKYWKVKSRTPSFSTVKVKRRRGWRASPRKSQYDRLIKQLARAYKLEPALVKAVIHVESAFRPRAKSHMGAMGLMQLMPATAKRFGVRNAYRPSENVLGGVRYLRWLFNHFDGNVSFVLAGYNAGENAVKRYGGIPPYRETRNYVKRVMSMRRLYRCDYEGRRSC